MTSYRTIGFIGEIRKVLKYFVSKILNRLFMAAFETAAKQLPGPYMGRKQ